MRRLYTLFYFSFFVLQAQSQSYDTTNYYGKMNYVFHYVDKGLVNTGMLRDYGIEFLNLDNYNGAVLHDSNYVAFDEWPMLYIRPYSSHVNYNAKRFNLSFHVL